MGKSRFAQLSLFAVLAADCASAQSDTGELLIYGNGEELATQGFAGERLTVDGWALNFSHIFVTVDGITAHQLSLPYDTRVGGDFQTLASAPTLGQTTLDLVDADQSNRVLIGSVTAPEGHYSALAWRIVPASSGEWAGYSLVMTGTASRRSERVEFTLLSDEEIEYRCGEYIGDVRKGFLKSGDFAEQELTFHLDHIFGRSDRASDDPMNLSALGFDPFAAGGTRKISLDGLHLGHVGEGHCAIVGL